MKKRLLFLMALCLILLTACGSNQAGKDTAHPYSWKEQRDGSIQLTIDGTVEDGYDWQVDGVDGSILRVEKLEKGNAKKTYYSVTALDRGFAALTFNCERDGVLQDRVFQISMQFQTDESGKLTVIGNSEQELQGVSSAGEDTNSPYIWQMEDGSLKLYITQKDSQGSWQAMGVDTAYLSVAGPIYDESGCMFRFTGKKAGETSTVLYDAKEGFGISLNLSLDETGQIKVTEHTEGPYEPAEDTVPGMAEFKALAGTVTLPKGARIERCETFAWSGTGEADTGRVRFLLSGKEWFCLVSKTVPLETMEEQYAAVFEEPYKTTLGGCPVMIYPIIDEGAAFWQDSQGRSIALFGRSNPMTEKIMEDAVEECIGNGNG